MVLPSDIIRDSGGYVDIIVVEKKSLKADETPLKVEIENKPEIATQTDKWIESDEQFKAGNDLILENEIDNEKEVEEFETEVESEGESADVTKREIDSISEIQGDEQIELVIEVLESDEDTENDATRRVKAEREEL
jgi:hypothetical protein